MEEHYEMTGTVMRRLRTADRFDNYREVTARWPGMGACGHEVKKGDRIGWNKRHGIRCAACWSRWVAENAAADADERFMTGGY